MTTGEHAIYTALVRQGVRHPRVWRGYSNHTCKRGWHFTAFGRSEHVYLGRSVIEALAALRLREEAQPMAPQCP